VRYGTEFGFLGFYIVKPAYRGQGHGLRLWRAAMDRLGSRNVGLDGVLAQQNTYRESGFKLAYRNIRHAGVGGGSVPRGLIDLSVVAFNEVVRYDETVFPAPRATFLSRWIRQREGEALGVVGNEGLSGYGVLRACRRGFKIGPPFADDVGVADLLFRGLVSRVTGQSVFLDTPEANSAAIELAKRHGMTPTFETARMYTREPPKSRLDRCFGVTTFELGEVSADRHLVAEALVGRTSMTFAAFALGAFVLALGSACEALRAEDLGPTVELKPGQEIAFPVAIVDVRIPTKPATHSNRKPPAPDRAWR
jgi:Acetyltransferase (GNAT) domain